MNTTNARTGLDALLRPEDSILVLIDHQPYQFASLNSHEPTMIVNNVVGLAKTAKVFNVPAILTTVIEERGGYLIKALQDVFPEQKPIDRTFINTWQDERVVEAVRKTGRNSCSPLSGQKSVSPCLRSTRSPTATMSSLSRMPREASRWKPMTWLCGA
jgi:hypothetical protein